MSASPTSLDVLPRDLQPCRRGKVGIGRAHRFESGRPGPPVLVDALTHGNEFCGMVAATQPLDEGVRPLVGTPLIQHGLPGSTQHRGVAMVAECGQHFERASSEPARLPIVGREGVYLARPMA